jgi:CheY-like chemotaxis protein
MKIAGKDGIRILIVDQNKVYASLVREVLAKHIDASIDIAVNVFELRRKLAERKYELVIADLAVAQDEDEITDALEKANTTVIAWTAINKKCRRSCVANFEMRKPSSVEEMRSLVPTLVQGRI